VVSPTARPALDRFADSQAAVGSNGNTFGFGLDPRPRNLSNEMRNLDQAVSHNTHPHLNESVTRTSSSPIAPLESSENGSTEQDSLSPSTRLESADSLVAKFVLPPLKSTFACPHCKVPLHNYRALE
jgi:hypothetical protein